MNIEIVTDNFDQREQLTAFLGNFENTTVDKVLWKKRLSFWWEENPFFDEHTPRGWILTEGGTIHGFFGSIPMSYCTGRKIHNALNSSTWRVDYTFRRHSLSLYNKYYKLKDD